MWEATRSPKVEGYHGKLLVGWLLGSLTVVGWLWLGEPAGVMMGEPQLAITFASY